MEPLLLILAIIAGALFLIFIVRPLIEALEEIISGLLKIAFGGSVVAILYVLTTTIAH